MSKERRAPELLTSDLIARVAALTARASEVADGLWGGSHRSARQGASVVFVERRAYSPGDDPRLLDWRALARTDRPSIKRFEEEAEWEAHLLLDRSASMAWSHGTHPSKLEHGALLLAALAFLLARQRDRVGLAYVDSTYTPALPASSQPGQSSAVIRNLATAESTEARTNLGAALELFAERQRRRSLVVLASDLLDEGGFPQEALRMLRARGHELRILHILDPAELEFPFDAPARFRGLEGEATLTTDPRRVADAYRAQADDFVRQARDRSLAAHASYALARTDARPEQTLAELLAPTPRARQGRRWA